MRFLLTLFSFFVLSLQFAFPQKLSPLAPRPDWPALEAFQQTITAERFRSLLNEVYCPDGSWQQWIKISSNQAIIHTRPGKPPFILQFAPNEQSTRPIPRYWHPRSQIPPPPPNRPLNGVHIALDPGHLGGPWAKMEERWFQIGDSTPVIEGDMTLLVAKILRKKLEDLGARVSLVRSASSPLTKDRPEKLRKKAIASLRQRGAKLTEFNIQKESELLFYRTSEIRARADRINKKLQPDVVLCLHFNAEAWGNPAKPTLTDVNHLHFLILGGFGKDELEFEDQRFNLLVKLLNRSHDEELALARSVARAMAKATELPPYIYKNPNIVRFCEQGYIWGRNLLANRLFECPVLFAEPYVMNSYETFARIQAGDYKGLRFVAGKKRPSIYREYADAITEGLVEYYSRR